MGPNHDFDGEDYQSTFDLQVSIRTIIGISFVVSLIITIG
jgi:hypothetical protein